MGIFTRFKDIVSANINSMLDKAENPEKMIRLVIQEMEETLVELKSSCAGIMADKKKTERDQEFFLMQVQKWQERAELAISKEREDLAKEALIEKSQYKEKADRLLEDIHHYDSLIKQSQDDISQLESKINTAKEKQQLLIKRHIVADHKLKTQKEIRRSESFNVLQKFEEFEQKIDRMEAEANLVNHIHKATPDSLEGQFSRLENEDKIKQELAKLKEKNKISKSEKQQ
ncbi:MAG: phage shock protein PspA [Chitinispirillia bacterium]